MAQNSKGEAQQLTIPACGRHALVGYLYDERSDQFTGINVFKGKISGDAITETQNAKTTLNVSMVDTIRDKIRLYDIKAHVQANLLSGMLQVKGSAEYLQHDNYSLREVAGIMLYRCETVVENLQIYFEELKGHYNTDVVNQKGATHIVTQIKWGGDVAIKFSRKAENNTEKQTIKGSLEVVFEKAKGTLSINAKASADIRSDDTVKTTAFSLDVKGDILLPDKTPTTPEEVQVLLKQVPNLVKKSNNGKGVPLEFTLTPLSHLRKHLEHSSKENEFAKQLDESILNDFVSIFETISEIAQQLNDYVSDFRTHSVCVSPQARVAILDLQGKFTNEKLKFQGQMKETIFAVRSGKLGSDALVKITKEYEACDFSPLKVRTKLNEFDETIKKMEKYTTICKSFPEVKYFGYKSNLDAALLSNIKNIIYILYLFPPSPENDGETQQENENLFFKTLNHSFNKLFVVDCEFDFGQKPRMKRTVIKQIVNGKVNIEDVNDVVKKQKTTDPLDMKALGRYGKIGQLYNVTSETFLNYNLLSPTMPESELHSVKKSGLVQVFDIPSENLNDKFKSLNVNPELQFSILSGMISLPRSGQYLTQSDESQMFGDMAPVRSFVHLRRTTEEYISLSDPNLLKHIVAEALSKGATHFVSKINYGLVTIFQAQQQILKNESNTRSDKVPAASKTEEENKVETQSLEEFATLLKAIVKSIIISKDAKSKDLEKKDLQKLSQKFTVKVYSDIQGEDDGPEELTGNEDLLFFLNNTFLAKQINKNNKKGMPIAYVLYPIANLGSEIGILSPYIPYDRLSHHFTKPNELVVIFEEIDLARNQIRQMSELLAANHDCVTDEDLSKLQNIREGFESTICKPQERIKNIIISIKKGEEKPEKFGQLLSEYKQLKIFDNSRRYNELKTMDAIREKIQTLKQFKKIDIDCIGHPSLAKSFDEILIDKNSATSKIYFLMYHSSWTKCHNELWSENRATFLNLANDKQNVLYVVNCEFEHEIWKTIDKPTIYEYVNRSRTSTDYVATMKGIVEVNVEEESELQIQVRILQETVQRYEQKELDLERRVDKIQDNLKSDSLKNQNKIDVMESNILTINSKINDVPRWVPYNKDSFPSNAVVAGIDADNDTIYVARGQYDGDTLPGKLCTKKGPFYLAWEGEEIKQDYPTEILVSPPGVLQWIKTSDGKVTDNAIPGGKLANRPLYVGRCDYKGITIPGWIDPSKKACFISHGHYGISECNYEVLSL